MITKRVSTPWVSCPKDPGKRMEPVKGEFRVKTNSLSCFVFVLTVGSQIVVSKKYTLPAHVWARAASIAFPGSEPRADLAAFLATPQQN